MEFHDVQEALWRPYYGFLDPRNPNVLTTERMLPFTSPQLKRQLWDYKAVKEAMSAPELTRELKPKWLPPWVLNPMMTGPTTQPRGPMHDLLRATATAVFSPDAYKPAEQSLRQPIQNLVQKYLQQETFNIAELAGQATYEAILYLLDAEDRTMIGDRQRSRFFRWQAEFAAAPSAFRVPPQLGMRYYFWRYVQNRMRQHRSGDAAVDQLLRTQELSTYDRMSDLIFVLTSSTVTTSNAITSACALLLQLLQDPERAEEGADVLARLRADPQLLHRVYQETIRFHGPVISRPLRVVEPYTATQIIKRGDTEETVSYTMQPGALVGFCWASANHDPAYFTKPDAFVPFRKPNHHLGFSHGDYSCPGQGLSGLVATSVLEGLLPELDRLIIQDLHITNGGIALRFDRLIVGRK